MPESDGRSEIEFIYIGSIKLQNLRVSLTIWFSILESLLWSSVLE